MQPASLQPPDFAAYPPQARALATRHIALLRQLPMPLLPILLRELSTFDWKFPRERQEIDAQLRWLNSMPAASLNASTQSFRDLNLPNALSSADWVNNPSGYMEQLTSTLWSTHQMPAFRIAAQKYAKDLAAFEQPGMQTPQQQAPQQQAPPALPRLVLVVLADSLGSPSSNSPLFRNLRREGVSLTNIDPTGGYPTLLAHLAERHNRAPQAYAHWQIDGGPPHAIPGSNPALDPNPTADPDRAIVTVNYDALAPTRTSLLARARAAMAADRSGPEELRTLMARLTPETISLNDQNNPAEQTGLARDPVLAHFQLSLLTEGSGTQIFSTTFVQWAARECLRRAQPATLLCRFTPRQREQGMNDLLGGATPTGLDPQGSLIDADQAAWYTWLNLQRLPHPETSRFLVWQQGTPTAVVIGPGLPRGTTSSQPLTMPQLLNLLA